MKLCYNEYEERYVYSFSVGELYEFGRSILLDLKSPLDDFMSRCGELTYKEQNNVALWAVGASENGFQTLDELKNDFLCWYGVNVGRGGSDNG